MSEVTTEEGYETTKYNINKSFEIAYRLCEDFLQEYYESEEYKVYCKACKEWKETELYKSYKAWVADEGKKFDYDAFTKARQESEAYQTFDKARTSLGKSNAEVVFLGKLSIVEKIYHISTDSWKSRRWEVI